LVAAIENPEEADVVIDRIASSVTGGYAPQRWPLLSKQQRQAVAVYLRFQIERFPSGAEEERKALEVIEAANQSPERTAAPVSGH
jgi:hypothetical protein